MPKKHPLADCDNCPLKDAPVCHTSGPPDAEIAFVSRSPGVHDVRNGYPFAGPSGQILDHLLKKNGVVRRDILTTNVVLCKSDDPPLAAIKACRPRLEAEIDSAKLILAGGVEAASTLTKYRSITRGRGFRISRTSISGNVQTVVITNNPAAVMRDNDQYPNMVADFKRAFHPLPPPTYPKVRIINDKDRAESIFTEWGTSLAGSTISADLEWHGTHIQCAGFSRDGTKAVVFTDVAIADNRSFRSFIERRDIKFIWHNGKSDTTILKLNGIDARVDEDTFLMSYALDERPGFHALEYLLSSEFGWKDYEPQSVKNFKSKGVLPDRKSAQELYTYNGWDAAGTKQLYDSFVPRIEEEGLNDLYKRLLRVDNTFRTVEMHGFRFDVEEACNINEREVYPRLWKLEEELQEISGRTLLNPRSVPQMQAVYYVQFGLKHGLRDMGKKKLRQSTGKEVRKEIEDGRFECKPQFKEKLVEFAATHQRHAKIQKLKSSFIEGLSKRVTNEGYIYCQFNAGGTVSGRASSKDPNLQNIIREEIESIPGIRTLFLPSEGNVILSADYSQAELRTCAKLSGDENLLAIYRDSTRSLHKERAIAFYGENYTKEQYVWSKNINFGVTYGQSAKAFAQMYHMPESQAQAQINSWWTDFPQLKVWTNETWKEARSQGYLQSPFGHRRRIHLVTEENVGDLKRELVNFKPQNIAAWLTMLSMCDLVDRGIRVVATVHDSIVVDCPEDQVPFVSKLMYNIMINKPIEELGWERDDIPFEVDISVGPNWGTLHEIELLEAA